MYQERKLLLTSQFVINLLNSTKTELARAFVGRITLFDIQCEDFKCNLTLKERKRIIHYNKLAIAMHFLLFKSAITPRKQTLTSNVLESVRLSSVSRTDPTQTQTQGQTQQQPSRNRPPITFTVKLEESINHSSQCINALLYHFIKYFKTQAKDEYAYQTIVHYESSIECEDCVTTTQMTEDSNQSRDRYIQMENSNQPTYTTSMLEDKIKLESLLADIPAAANSNSDGGVGGGRTQPDQSNAEREHTQQQQLQLQQKMKQQANQPFVESNHFPDSPPLSTVDISDQEQQQQQQHRQHPCHPCATAVTDGMLNVVPSHTQTQQGNKIHAINDIKVKKKKMVAKVFVLLLLRKK